MAVFYAATLPILMMARYVPSSHLLSEPQTSTSSILLGDRIQKTITEWHGFPSIGKEWWIVQYPLNGFSFSVGIGSCTVVSEFDDSDFQATELVNETFAAEP